MNKYCGKNTNKWFGCHPTGLVSGKNTFKGFEVHTFMPSGVTSRKDRRSPCREQHRGAGAKSKGRGTIQCVIVHCGLTQASSTNVQTT